MEEKNLTVKKPQTKKKLQGKQVWPYFFILPFFVVYLSFNFYPLIYSFQISLTDWDGFSEATFIGLENYIYIFTEDAYFLASIKNTLIFMAGTIPACILGGILLASLLNSTLLKANGFFRLAIFAPYLTIPVAIGVLFSLLFDWNDGAINMVLENLGLIDDGINFLGTPVLARGVVMLMCCWKYLGYHMIFFNAGILGIPMELYEAADVDGASSATKFFKITLPLLRPTTEFLLIMNIIWGFQLFDEPKVLFSSWTGTGGTGVVGGPLRSCLTAVWNLYDTTFGTQMEYGRGASIAYGLFLFILVFSAIMMTILKTTNRGGDE